jgi:two-component system chemotaxis response regulator CheB
MAPGTKSILPNVLAKSGPLPAGVPSDGDPIEAGRIHVAPNDHRMVREVLNGYEQLTADELRVAGS